MTAVEWLAEQLYPAIKLNSKIINELVEQAKEMERKQIIDAFDSTRILFAEEYYNETYGSKGSELEQIDQTNPVTKGSTALVKTTSEKWKEYQDWLNQVPELSDEDITKLANEHILYNDSKRQWIIEGMKLYREHLKQK